MRPGAKHHGGERRPWCVQVVVKVGGDKISWLADRRAGVDTRPRRGYQVIEEYHELSITKDIRIEKEKEA